MTLNGPLSPPAIADAQLHDHDHDGGLEHDLQQIEHIRLGRRNMLGWMASAGGAAIITACGGSGSSSTASTVTVSGTTTTTTTTTTTATPTPSPTSTTCTVYAAETNGPYPADGTNTAPGSTSNVLTVSGITRSDIRSSFIGSTTVAAGVPVTFTITVVDANNSCAPLAGYAVYIWHADRDGRYSLYDLPAETYLRGLQVTDANGRCTFTTIFPGCYAGRYPHIHFELFTSVGNATAGRFARLISQFALPGAACSTVYASTGYTSSATNFRSVSIANDNVFSDNSAAQITAMTMAMTGSVAAGYTATATVAIAT
ncbi:dioxygenase family protein [Sphingomonas sp. 35-24ZXX]|uniref:dioxygenase family protein n=1 Tax=Sphingomonas sp. 35-24ZXX TaxID=1545915 RepID=UPI00068C83FE|nr:intradiol ring-cleavage dioxygenase [Sphingomonas sp. 35-24ZXX]